MFLTYTEFLAKSEHHDIVDQATQMIMNNPDLDQVLNDCLNGVYAKIQIIETEGITKYVGVAVNNGIATSNIYCTTNPKVALLCTMMDNMKTVNAQEIIDSIKLDTTILEYDIFPGIRRLTLDELKTKYQMKDSLKGYITILTAAAIKKTY